ncbi:hypothetical protein DY000_02019596 [Brassica cretica]|uniref:Multiple C2 domain-containing protein n=1 Tax=Brassica cretica TaxID=69181 RepID=A0ABQ7D963_BRACR|nr:hypothetical protein DY000_02019596 [Brassica cretica]
MGAVQLAVSGTSGSGLGILLTWTQIKISWAEAASPDELDEEFDIFPTSKGQDVVKMRYEYDR